MSYGYQDNSPRGTVDGAVAALVCGILSFVACGIFTGIPAMVMGRRAMRDVDYSGGQLEGRGMAQAGWIMGLISTVLTVGVIVIAIIIVAAGGGSTSTR